MKYAKKKEIRLITWEEYYDKFYDWAESTQIKKLSSVKKYGSAEEVTEIMPEFAFVHEDIVNRMARKAIEQHIVFSAENVCDLSDSMDAALIGKSFCNLLRVFLMMICS